MEDWAATDPAWQLAELAGPHLPDSDRTHVFVAIGASDILAAIDILIKTIVAEEICVPRPLVADIADWLSAYRSHDDAARLLELLKAIKREN